jgi:NTP pyrophosphatase (non-canonical NTP hydrolase)
MQEGVRDSAGTGRREEMKLSELQIRCFKQAQDCGWNEQEIPLPEMVALLHSEASEALEAYRNHEPMSWRDEKNKPQGVASEFADLIIRVCHYAELLGIDLEEEVEQKLQYNLTRGYRHGGKAV